MKITPASSNAGEHYADILLSLYQRQLKELREERKADRAEAEGANTKVDHHQIDSVAPSGHHLANAECLLGQAGQREL